MTQLIQTLKLLKQNWGFALLTLWFVCVTYLGIGLTVYMETGRLLPGFTIQ